MATWNIAAINNNPFEYWITHDDADYNALMEGVQSFIDQPGARLAPATLAHRHPHNLAPPPPSPRLASPRLDQPGARRHPRPP